MGHNRAQEADSATAAVIPVIHHSYPIHRQKGQNKNFQKKKKKINGKMSAFKTR